MPTRLPADRAALALCCLLLSVIPRIAPLPTGAQALPASAGAGLGVTLAIGAHAAYLPELGVGWARTIVSWADSEPSPGQFQWAGADAAVNQITPVAHLIFQIAYTPAWARPNPADPGMTPPRDPQLLARFAAALAARYRGRVAAYEIWNEPNLGLYWGNRKPDAAGYVALLRAVSPAIRAADPRARIVSAGPALVGNRDDTQAVGQEAYLRAMYAAGFAGLVDVVGMHLYGYTFAPEENHAHPAGFYFREGEALHAIMEAAGDGARPVWITEMGWLMQAPCAIPGDQSWQQVSPTTQADYTVRAIQYARQHWPWAGVLVLFNLDYSMVGWLDSCDAMRWRSLLNSDGTPRPVFQAVQALIAGGTARPAANTVDPWYFAATGQTLAPQFRAYWQSHGGLANLGYPIDEIHEDGDYMVQFTERARLEWHPENRNTPYEVQLGRLGDWLRPERAVLADRRVPDGQSAAVLAARGWPPSPNHISFAATGQAVYEPFLSVWQAQGGLDRFGYPLTPARLELNEAGAPVVTQWFERARFEWHPEFRGTPYEVLQGRLGAELLQTWSLATH